MKKICAHCGKPFEVNNKVQRYCSPKCKNNGKAKRKRCGKDNFEPIIIDDEPVHFTPNTSDKEVFKHKCVVCGKEFETVYETKIYCSLKCRRKANRHKYSCITEEVEEIPSEHFVVLENDNIDINLDELKKDLDLPF